MRSKIVALLHFFQLDDQFFLLIGVEVGVGLKGGFYILMPQAFGDHQGRIAQLDQQGGVRMAQVVHADLLDSGELAAALHFTEQV